ncbi:MAG: hypothetical protein RLO50_22440 [Azospirillaceae bacterium]
MRRLAGLFFTTVLVASCAEPPPPPPPPRVDPLAGLFPPIFDDYFELAHPPGACVTQEEMEADLMIRLRNEVMVSSLTCQSAYGGDQAFIDYVNFTTVHAPSIRNGQETLGNFLGRYLGGSRARLFDTYITEMANQESQTVINVSPGRYCAARRTQFETATDFDQSELDRYLTQAMVEYGENYPLCDSEPPLEQIVASRGGTMPVNAASTPDAMPDATPVNTAEPAATPADGDAAQPVDTAAAPNVILPTRRPSGG